MRKHAKTKIIPYLRTLTQYSRLTDNESCMSSMNITNNRDNLGLFTDYFQKQCASWEENSQTGQYECWSKKINFGNQVWKFVGIQTVLQVPTIY